MKRLAIALSVLLTLNLLTSAMRWLLTSSNLPILTLSIILLISLGLIALVYFSTLEVRPDYSLDYQQGKIYALAGVAGVLLGLL